MATITEILKAAEDDIRTILNYKDDNYLRMILSCAYFPQYKLKLPEGTPPYTPNPMAEAQVLPGVFWQVCKKIDMYLKDYDKKTTARVENSFIQALETVSANEALILLAVKDQTLEKMYKGVTLEALYNVGYYKRPA